MQVIPSEIENVTVYSSGAVVVRTAEVAPSGGEWPSQVRLAGLPLALDDASVKIRIAAVADNGGIRAVSFRVGLDVLDGAAMPEPWEEPLRAARQQVCILEERLQDVERLSGVLQYVSAPARPSGAKGEAPPPSPYAGRAALLDFRIEQLRTLSAAAEELRGQIRAAREVLAAAEERKRVASSMREARPNQLRKTLVVALQATSGASATPARLVFEYHVPGARWAPAYAIHFDADLTRATVAVRAMVAQRTGEDWRNVRIALSTAQMQAWTELPELTALRIGRWQSPPRSGWRAAPAGAEDLYSDYDREAAELKREAPVTPVAELERLLETAEPAPPRPAQPATKTLERRKPPSDRAKEAAPGEFTQMFNAPSQPPVPMPPPPPSPAPAEYTMMRRAAPPTAQMPAMPQAAKPMFTPPAPRPMMQPAPPPGAVMMAYLGEPSPPVPPESPRLIPASLDYGAMHMPDPRDSGRGKLTRIDVAARLQVFAQLHVQIRVDTVAVVGAARNQAAQLGALPAQHSFPLTVEGFDYVYRADLPVDIPSDGQYHSIPLASQSAASRLYYVTVPRETPDVFRFAEVQNPLDAPLLPGPADIYTGSTFLMTVPLRVTPPKTAIQLGMGVEQRIEVARNTNFAESASGLVGGTLNLKHDIHIELRNQLRVPAQIEVRERVPVAREGDNQIKVSTTAKPAWEPFDPPGESLRGGYAWKVQVQPSETTQLHATYSIAMPAKMELSGGNRREA